MECHALLTTVSRISPMCHVWDMSLNEIALSGYLPGFGIGMMVTVFHLTGIVSVSTISWYNYVRSVMPYGGKL